MPSLHERNAQGQLELLFAALDASYKALKAYNPNSPPPAQPISIDVAVVTLSMVLIKGFPEVSKYGESWINVVLPVREGDLSNSLCRYDDDTVDEMKSIQDKLVRCCEIGCSEVFNGEEDAVVDTYRISRWRGYACVPMPFPKSDSLGIGQFGRVILEYAPPELKGPHLKLEVATNFMFDERDFPSEH